MTVAMLSVLLDEDKIRHLTDAELAGLVADERALWAVRVLDAYADKAKRTTPAPHSQTDGSYVVAWNHVNAGGSIEYRVAEGPTRDAARIAAATALVAADPSLDT